MPTKSLVQASDIAQFHQESKEVFSQAQAKARLALNVAPAMLPVDVKVSAQSFVDATFPSAPNDPNDLNAWIDVFNEMETFSQTYEAAGYKLADFAARIGQDDPELLRQAEALKARANIMKAALGGHETEAAVATVAADSTTPVAKPAQTVAAVLTANDLLHDNVENGTFLGNHRLSVEEIAADLHRKNAIGAPTGGSFSELEAINAVQAWVKQSPENRQMLNVAVSTHLQDSGHVLDKPLADIYADREASPTNWGADIVDAVQGFFKGSVVEDIRNVSFDDILSQAPAGQTHHKQEQERIGL